MIGKWIIGIVISMGVVLLFNYNAHKVSKDYDKRKKENK